MAVHEYDPIGIRGKGRVQISGMFYPQGASTPLFGSTAVSASCSAIRSGSSSASGWSVARNGAGDFIVTLNDTTITEIVDAQATLGLGAAADAYAQMGVITMGTSGAKTTVHITLITGAAAADQNANNDARVSFRFTCRRSSVKG